MTIPQRMAKLILNELTRLAKQHKCKISKLGVTWTQIYQVACLIEGVDWRDHNAVQHHNQLSR
jgi:hypothetical protein